VLTSAVRAFSPFFFTTVFAICVTEEILGGFLVWSVMVFPGIILAVAAIYLPKRAEGIIKHNGHAD
jgi:hypothetical protein